MPSNSKYKIYLIINKQNNKVYVGFTGQKYISRRWNKHCFLARTGCETYFYNALRKYGKENFEIVTVAETDSETNAFNLEKLWIWVLQANIKEFGYNTTSGGEHPFHTEETKEKISQLQRGRKPSIQATKNHNLAMLNPEYRKQRSAITSNLWKDPEFRSKRLGDNHWTRRIGASQETILKRSVGLKKAWASGKMKGNRKGA